MTLSIIIVNYNVRHFLEQCLLSVQKAMAFDPGNIEVWVVDNASTDDSKSFFSSNPSFHWVHFIWNEENKGFARANNQALALAKGEYVLFLNPDTLLPEDILQKQIAFMNSHPRAGACGVRMVDGNGHFLPESKRGFPHPWASFYKLTGLIHFFPHSKKIAHYYAGHLSEHQNAVVDVLSGAYMLIRKSILDKIGGFDERFFMYAEDIDLSYRLQKEGYDNIYYAESTITHFKGESTKKNNLQYVKMFYLAMDQFVEKHYGKRSPIYRAILRIAIRARAAVSAVGKVFRGK